MGVKLTDTITVRETGGGDVQKHVTLTEVEALFNTEENASLVSQAARIAALETIAQEATAPNYATAASKVLTVAAEPAEGETVTLGTTTYKARRTALGAGVAASAVLTSNESEIADGDTVTIGTTVYRFKDTPAAAYDVKRHGTTADTTLGNLVKAVNLSGTGDGTDYLVGTGGGAMVIHPAVGAGEVTAHAITFTAKSVGFAGNAIAKAKNAECAELDWDGEGDVFTGGIDAQAANDIYTGGTAEIFIDNLVLAVTDVANRAANIAAGKYGTATAVHATVTAAKASASTMTATARTKGAAGNSIAVGETLSNGSSVWDNVGSTRVLLQGGITGTVGVQGEFKYSTAALWVCVDAATAITTDSSGWKYITFTG